MRGVFSRRVIFHGGAAGVAATLAACSGSDADTPEPGNDYVVAPPQPRTFTPPDELDLRGESQVALPLADGARLYYWDTGGLGPPIVLVHAATGSAYVWGYQQRAF